MENIKDKLINMEENLRRNNTNIIRVQGGQDVKNGENTNPQNQEALKSKTE